MSDAYIRDGRTEKSVCKSRQKFVEVNDNLCTRLLDPLIYIAHATKVFRYLPQIIKNTFLQTRAFTICCRQKVRTNKTFHRRMNTPVEKSR